MKDLGEWRIANQRFLGELIEVLYQDLVERTEKGPLPARVPRSMSWPLWTGPRGTSPVIRSLTEVLGLDRFERDLLLLGAAMELDGRFASLCEVAHGNPQLNHPTLSLALTTFAGSRWDALTPDATLSKFHLVKTEQGPVSSVARLRVEPRVVFGLLGIQDLDPRIKMRVQDLTEIQAVHLSPSQEGVRDAILAAVRGGAQRGQLPLVQLLGEDLRASLGIAREVGLRLDLTPERIPAEYLPTEIRELDDFLGLWRRETLLARRALLLDAFHVQSDDRAIRAAVNRAITELEGLVFIVAPDRWIGGHRPSAVYEVRRPNHAEQRDLWRRTAGQPIPVDPAHFGTSDGAEVLAASFDLDGRSIAAALVQAGGTGQNLDFQACWDACRIHARANLSELAQRVESQANWGDLVLPPTALALLDEIESQVRHRVTVYGKWGFAGKTGRGKGISVMFSGPSGVGKTLAAEVLANRLGLDLWRIDLSAVVSKYIGETQKNLRKVFDAAEGGGAVLLFDEADSLFSKRTQVKDHHDRHANMEVGYLLQRMEAYRGLAILTTNMKSSIDGAFVRRLRYVVEFPFPDRESREEIWRRVLPKTAPIEGVDPVLLSQLHVTGAVIRSIVVNAAFRAAADGVALQMRHLLQATRRQYQMLGQPLSDLEIDGW